MSSSWPTMTLRISVRTASRIAFSCSTLAPICLTSMGMAQNLSFVLRIPFPAPDGKTRNVFLYKFPRKMFPGIME